MSLVEIQTMTNIIKHFIITTIIFAFTHSIVVPAMKIMYILTNAEEGYLLIDYVFAVLIIMVIIVMLPCIITIDFIRRIEENHINI